MDMDWSKLNLVVYTTGTQNAGGMVFVPGDNDLHKIELVNKNGKYSLATDPYDGKVSWNISKFPVTNQ